MSQKIFLATLLLASSIYGQVAPPSAAPNAAPGLAALNNWGTRIIALKYLDPEQLRSLFSSRSYVMETNRELKLLTVSGPTQFLDEVEQTGKRFDLAPPLPANFEVTVYLLATAAQAPAAQALPTELQALGKALDSGSPGQSLRLADLQVMRVREGQGGDVSFTDTTATGVRLSHISLQAAYVNPGTKGEVVSLNNLHCWMVKPADQPAPAGDMTVSIDVAPNDAALVAKTGLDKPLILLVRAKVSR